MSEECSLPIEARLREIDDRVGRAAREPEEDALDGAPSQPHDVVHPWPELDCDGRGAFPEIDRSLRFCGGEHDARRKRRARTISKERKIQERVERRRERVRVPGDRTNNDPERVLELVSGRARTLQFGRVRLRGAELHRGDERLDRLEQDRLRRHRDETHDGRVFAQRGA